jgi:signal recognition particle subunit SRP54
MFDSLSDRLGGVFDRLRGRGALTEADVRTAMREVRVALLEADVALPVARSFVDKVTEQAVGQNVLRSVTPGQQVVKIVNDALVEMLGADASELELAVAPPAVIMMVGLQGSGKTTTTAKIAKRLVGRERRSTSIAPTPRSSLRRWVRRSRSPRCRSFRGSSRSILPVARFRPPSCRAMTS